MYGISISSCLVLILCLSSSDFMFVTHLYLYSYSNKFCVNNRQIKGLFVRILNNNCAVPSIFQLFKVIFNKIKY